jgi:hypothetical protein
MDPMEKENLLELGRGSWPAEPPEELGSAACFTGFLIEPRRVNVSPAFLIVPGSASLVHAGKVGMDRTGSDCAANGTAASVVADGASDV